MNFHKKTNVFFKQQNAQISRFYSLIVGLVIARFCNNNKNIYFTEVRLL